MAATSLAVKGANWESTMRTPSGPTSAGGAACAFEHVEVGREFGGLISTLKSGACAASVAAVKDKSCGFHLFGRISSQGCGSHLEPSGSRLKWDVVTHGASRYCASSTMEVTTSHWSPLVSLCTS